jgi:hypothetical protein
VRDFSTADLVEVWEQGWTSGSAQRAHLLVSRMHPEMPEEELATLPLGVRDDMLLQLRRQLFGPSLESVVSCPQCRESLEVRLDVDDLRSGGASEEARGSEWVDGDLAVRFRVPTSADLRELEGHRDVEEVRRRLLERCLVEAHRGSERIGPSQLTREETIALGARIGQADPRGELMLDARCPSCGHRWEALFDIASFLWHELDVHVRRLFGEVHTLALAYSWSERDILAMSTRRRQTYLNELLAR